MRQQHHLERVEHSYDIRFTEEHLQMQRAKVCIYMVSRISFVPVITLLLMLNASAAIEPVDATTLEQSKTAETETPPPPIARTLAEVNKLQIERPDQASEFDVEAKLAFAAKLWTVFYVQDGAHYYMVECADAVTNMLSKHPPGTRVHMRGYTARYAPTLKIFSIELTTGDTSLDVTNIDSFSSTLAPIETYAKAIVAIESSFIGREAVIFSSKLDNATVQLELYQVLSPEAAATYLNTSLTAWGALTKSSTRELGEDYKLRMMRQEQMQKAGLLNSSLNISDLTEIRGQVVFTNHRDRLVLMADRKVHQIQSNFAPRLKNGDWISAYVYHDESEPNKCRLLKFHSHSELSKTIAIERKQHIDAITLPGPYSLVADVVDIQPISGGFDITANGPAGKIDAHVYSPKATRAELGVRKGDRVRFAGTLAASTSRNAKLAKYDLYVPDESGVTFLSSPTMIAPQFLGWTIGLGTFLSLFFIAWNRSLRGRVLARTKELDQLSSHLRESFEAIREAILICNHENKIVDNNTRFETIFGLRPTVGQPLTEVLRAIESQSGETAAVRACFLESLSGTKRKGSTTFTLKDSTTIQYYMTPIFGKSGKLQGHLWAFEDITEKLILEAKLVQSQKMEAIGKLSGGVAHDFNNLLNVIRATLSTLTLLRNSGSSSQPMEQESIQIAEQAVDRAAELTQQLLDFSRKSNLELVVININTVAERAFKFARRVISPTIPIRLILFPTPVYASADASRLEQVILNLIINAKDALPDGLGEISVSTALIFDADQAFAEIRISDNGCGIAPEIQSRIFEPFFTTKVVGEGTGLGLSMAIGVIEQMRGTIDCKSQLDLGSTFTIRLPKADFVAVSEDLASSGESHPPHQPSLKLLLVDDEPMIRKSVGAMLQIMGHEVQTAENGNEALVKFAEMHFDLLLLDLAMPGISGAQVYDQIRRVDAKIPVIICTGNAENLAVAEGGTPPSLLKKPYRIKELADAISAAMTLVAQGDGQPQ